MPINQSGITGSNPAKPETDLVNSLRDTQLDEDRRNMVSKFFVVQNGIVTCTKLREIFGFIDLEER